MSLEAGQGRAVESKVSLVKGTADVLPNAYTRLHRLESLLLDRFARAGYAPIRVPVLENRALHERKSGARVVAHLYQVEGALNEDVCLRPELTAGIVRAFNDDAEPALPWRVSYSGPVFRLLPTGPGVLREFQQVGVERIDDRGNGGDAETIWLADWALSEAGIADATIRIGHAGLIRDLLKWSKLPLGVQVALVEVLNEAAQAEDGLEGSSDRFLSAMETHLESLADWLSASAGSSGLAVPDQDIGVDRLFRTLYPEVVGRRGSSDVIGRLKRKWELGRGLSEVLSELRDRLHELADLRGPAADVLARLVRFEEIVPDMIRELRGLVAALEAYGIDLRRVELDLGFGRGIGFYSQMMFVLLADTPAGPLEVCGGGRYDGLARALGSSRDIGGVGFAIGLERLSEVLMNRGLKASTPATGSRTLVLGGDAEAYGLAAWLRSAGQTVIVESTDGRPASVLAESARSRGIDFLVELAGSKLRLTELASHKQTSIDSRNDLLRLLSPTGARS